MALPVGVLATPETIAADAATGASGLFTYVLEWTKFLVRHNSDHQIHFFVPLRELESAERTVAAWPTEWRRKCLIFSIEDLSYQLHSLDYLSFHVPGGPRLGALATVVHGLSATNIPVTATQHAVSYPVLVDIIHQQLLGGSMAWDALVCPSSASMDAHRRLLAHITDWVSGVHGVNLMTAHAWHVIPHGVDTERFAPSDRTAARQMLGLRTDVPILISVGRITPLDKADLLPVLRVLANLSVETHLLVVGDDRLHASQDLQTHAAQMGIGARLHIFRNASPVALGILYRCADAAVFAFDNIQESLGIAVLEAMACGLPCIIPSWNGTRELIENGRSGFVVSTRNGPRPSTFDAIAELEEQQTTIHSVFAQTTALDIRELRTAVETVVASSELRLRMGAAARERACSEYAWPKIIARYHEMWAELKRIATADTRRHVPLPRFAVGSAFSHYADRGIPERVRIQARPGALNSWTEVLGRIPELGRYISRVDVTRVLELCSAAMGEDAVELSIGERCAVAWLLKHDFVVLEE